VLILRASSSATDVLQQQMRMPSGQRWVLQWMTGLLNCEISHVVVAVPLVGNSFGTSIKSDPSMMTMTMKEVRNSVLCVL
jgi:hypothetical protein